MTADEPLHVHDAVAAEVGVDPAGLSEEIRSEIAGMWGAE